MGGNWASIWHSIRKLSSPLIPSSVVINLCLLRRDFQGYLSTEIITNRYSEVPLVALGNKSKKCLVWELYNPQNQIHKQSALTLGLLFFFSIFRELWQRISTGQRKVLSFTKVSDTVDIILSDALPMQNWLNTSVNIVPFREISVALQQDCCVFTEDAIQCCYIKIISDHEQSH